MTTATMNRPGRTRGLLVIGALGILIAAAVTYFAVNRSPATTPATTQAPVTTPVQAVEAKTGPIRATLNYAGTVDPVHQATLSSRASGIITERLVDVGTNVRAGDTLVVLDGAVQRAQLRQAEAGIAAAQARFAQLTTGVKPTDVDAARSAVAAAEARYNQLVFPTDSARFAADAAVANATAAVENARGAAERARNALAAQISLYCQQYLKFGIDCATVSLPLTPAESNDLSGAVGTNFTDPLGLGGQRAQAILDANGALIAALANQETTKTAVQIAENNRQTLLNPSSADVAAARSAVDQARAGLETRLKPYSDGDLQGVQAGIAQAQAQAELARTGLDDTTIRAPFDGVIASTMVEVGGLVAPGAPVVSLVASNLEVALTVDEAKLSEVRAGIPVELTVGAFPGRVFTGHVDSIAPTGDARTHTFELKVRPDDPDGVLRSGMYAAVTLVSASKDSALLVPAAAVTTQPDGKSSVLTIKDGKAVLKPVKVGIRNTENVELLEGIARGERVIVVGQAGVRDGQAVTVKETPAS